MTVEDPFDLERFVAAQDAGGTYSRAVEELRAGDKTSHWMWFVFPQVAGLGQSSTSREFAISGLEEAKAYLQHPVLGPRLIECVSIVAETKGRTAVQIFGSIDALKLRSSMTLFMRAAPKKPLFQQVLDRYFDGRPDPATDQRLPPSLLVGIGHLERRLDDAVGLLHAYTTDDGLRYLDYEQVASHDVLVPDDLAVIILINSRVNGSAFKSVQDFGSSLPLASVPTTPLEDSTPALRQQVAELIAEMASWPGFASSVATKILHKKRSATIPILDNQAIFGAYMNPAWPVEPSRQDSIYAVKRIREALDWIHADLTAPTNQATWAELHRLAPTRTRVELFDMVWWSHFRRVEPVRRII